MSFGHHHHQQQQQQQQVSQLSQYLCSNCGTSKGNRGRRNALNNYGN
jgi:hypothetical protein